jgi:hypothetical protein
MSFDHEKEYLLIETTLYYFTFIVLNVGRSENGMSLMLIFVLPFQDNGKNKSTAYEEINIKKCLESLRLLSECFATF